MERCGELTSSVSTAIETSRLEIAQTEQLRFRFTSVYDQRPIRPPRFAALFSYPLDAQTKIAIATIRLSLRIS
ncbi:hypothetical protein RRG08_059460 [Elysia crispata]|uniref:Uncharacterized protein n=1 Tax=Elysia crispata TaxID=231223 RepID=A0AAE1A530_9GAST|nr:hypothetical protein RRG08_059460 [Elysia crispata]